MAVNSPSRFLIWGGGGHGKVVADAIRAAGHVVAGFVDADPLKLDTVVEPGGARVTLSQADLIAQVRGGSLPRGIDAVALAIGRNSTRLECYHELRPHWLPPVIHPRVVVSPSARVGPGSVVITGAILNAAARIGAAAIVNTGAIVEHDCVLGDGVHVSPGAVLAGGVHVGERSWIGAGATVIPGVRIGADVIVGAGAVVIRDVPDGVTVVGGPARIIET